MAKERINSKTLLIIILIICSVFYFELHTQKKIIRENFLEQIQEIETIAKDEEITDAEAIDEILNKIDEIKANIGSELDDYYEQKKENYDNRRLY